MKKKYRIFVIYLLDLTVVGTIWFFLSRFSIQTSSIVMYITLRTWYQYNIFLLILGISIQYTWYWYYICFIDIVYEWYTALLIKKHEYAYLKVQLRYLAPFLAYAFYLTCQWLEYSYLPPLLAKKEISRTYFLWT